ncbi:MAG: response regulator transcription factor, partial [Chloroflexaceae bacterium]
MSHEPIRIVLIDDHAIVRKGLRAFLDTYPEIEVVGEASGGAEGVALVTRVLPDVALMDLVMPEIS